MSAREPTAFAKIATRNDVIPPFYITEEYVKARDDAGYPVRIEVILGRLVVDSCFDAERQPHSSWSINSCRCAPRKFMTVSHRSPQPGVPIDEFDANFQWVLSLISNFLLLMKMLPGMYAGIKNQHWEQNENLTTTRHDILVTWKAVLWAEEYLQKRSSSKWHVPYHIS